MSDSKSNNEIILKGIAASPGVAHGRAFVYQRDELEIPSYKLAAEEIEKELERYEQAIVETRSEITEVRNKVASDLSEGEARIFDAHLMVLEDAALIEEVIAEMRETQNNIEQCYDKVARRYIAFFNSMEDEYLKERVTDIQDVSRRLLHNLIGLQNRDLGEVTQPSIVISTDLTPSDTANLERGKLLAFVTDAGGKTSHSVIMARSQQIPAVVGLHDVSHQVRTDDVVLVDGYKGIVVIHPTEERLSQYGAFATKRRKLDAIYRTVLDLPSHSADGSSLQLMANIERAEEFGQAFEVSADGVGLFRTEGLFLRDHGYPTEKNQYEEYRSVAECAIDKPVIFRTLDVGGDKLMEGHDNATDSSFMGFRAIRFCLENPDIFKAQLRAILRASAHGKVKVMFPMISGLEELRRAKEVLEEVKEELRVEGIAFDESMPVGAMVEIPSAALTIDLLAKEVDFLSIGTNDLIQYLMAVDRLNDRVTHLYEPAHPAVLRTLKQIFDAAEIAKVPVGVCGEIAGDPLFTAVLLGMGAQSLSMASGLLPELKYYLRKIDMKAAQALVDEILTMEDAAAILACLKEFHETAMGSLDAMVD